MNKGTIAKFFGFAMVQKDLILTLKKNRWLWMQFLYLAIFGIVLAFFVANTGLGFRRYDSPISLVTSSFVSLYFTLQFIVIGIVFPFLSGSSITSERIEKTWPLLKCTELSPFEIVRGKFFALISLSVYFMMLSAPLLMLTTLIGGVSLFSVVFEYSIHLCYAALICAAGLFSSTMSSNATRSNLQIVSSFSIPVLFATVFAVDAYRNGGLLSSALGPSSSYLSSTELLIYWFLGFFVLVGALLGASFSISPVNSLRSIPLRIYIFGFYLFGIFAFLELMAANVPGSASVRNYSQNWTIYMVVMVLSSLPLLRIAADEPGVPLSAALLTKEKPLLGRILYPFVSGGIRNLLFSFAVLSLFLILLKVGSIVDLSKLGDNVDSSLLYAVTLQSEGSFIVWISWLCAMMAMAWCLALAGFGSILSASVTFSFQLVLVLSMAIVYIANDGSQPAYSMFSTPFKYFLVMSADVLPSSGTTLFTYLLSRGDFLFNTGTTFFFIGLGAYFSGRNQRPLLSLAPESRKGLLLDPPGLAVQEQESGVHLSRETVRQNEESTTTGGLDE
ncbi:MAG: hypothetical protein P8K66_06090 [Planctomycetota bacterium]|nr:hypothetical protein [Planctomycetota bacterium]